MPFLPNCLPTAVGSLPHLNPQEGVELILRYLSQIPIWPQLPNSGFLESMYTQFSGGMPFVRLDAEKERIYMDLSGDIYVDLERFYAQVIAEDLDYFAISSEYARGLNALLERLWRSKPPELAHLKGQITGPISFGLMITDERKRSVLYHEEIFDAVLKSLALKARWQIRRLQRLWPSIIIFIDEPYLSSFGSAFINLNRDQVVQYMSELVAAIHLEGALAGVHCCGNTDWSILMGTELDIINFDACEYFQGITLYVDQLRAYLARGGVLAWGIVPTSPRAQVQDAEALQRSFWEKIENLTRRGIPREVLLQQCLLTPSCGMGSLRENQTETVLSLLSQVSLSVRRKIFGKKPHQAAS